MILYTNIFCTRIVLLCIICASITGKSLLPLKSMVKLVKSLSNNGEFRGFSEQKVHNALQIITTSQSAMKTLDGVTHQLRNSVKDSTSLQSRFNKFMTSKKRSKKEAAKVFEYTSTVEKGLLSSEILQAVSIGSDKERLNELSSSGLVELKRCLLSHNGLNCTMSILCGQSDLILTNTTSTHTEDGTGLSNYAKGELVIAITDHTHSGEKNQRKREFKTLQQLLKVLNKDTPLSVELTGSGVTDDEITVQPSLLTLSRYALGNVSEYLLLETESKKKSLSNSNFKRKATVDAKIKKKAPSSVEGPTSPTRRRMPHRLRILGYSAGGAVASYLAMVLEGTMNFNPSLQKTHADVRGLALGVGKYHGRVRCMTLGCPPCVSRSVVPQYITSIICGDDVVVRSTPETLQRFVRRVSKALKAGAGSGIPLGYMMSTGWMSDIAGSARQSLSKYTGNKHDISSLSIPGRVMFAKNRKMKSGATIQRVLRGNWQEDLLWQLHDILISTKMIEHHSLDNYIQTLNRC